MAFELIFGEKTVPGSSTVYNRLLKLGDRQDIAAFCTQVRREAAGGDETIQHRRQQVDALRKSGKEALENGHYEDAYNDFVEASEIIGDFDYDLVQCVYKALAGLKRFEEAIAVVYTCRLRYERRTRSGMAVLTDMVTQAYRQLGYEEGPNSAHKFDDDDFTATLESLLSIDSDVCWDRNLFLVAHIFYHLERNRKAAQKVFRRRGRDFISRIGENAKVNSLFANANFEYLTSAECRFMAWFALLIAKLLKLCDDSALLALHLAKHPWYQAFIQDFSATFVTKWAFVKIAFLEPGYAETLLSAWLSLALPIITGIEAKGGDILLTRPFDDFQWLVNASLLFVFSLDSHLDNAAPENGSPEFASYLMRDLSKITSNKYFAAKISKMSKQDFGRSVDLLLVLKAINFAEYKRDTMRNALPYGPNDRPSITNGLLLVLLHSLCSTFFSSLSKHVEPDFIFDHLAYFVMTADRLRFSVDQLDSTLREAPIIVSILTGLSICSSRVTSPDQLDALVNCRDFCTRFISSMSKYMAVAQNSSSSRDQIAKMVDFWAITTVNCLTCVSRSSCFAKTLFDEQAGGPLIEAAFDPEIGSAQCLANLLRSADKSVRRRWASDGATKVSLIRFGLQLFENILNPPSDFTPSCYINVLLAFHGLIGGSSPIIVQLDEILPSEEQRLALISKMFQVVGDFPRFTKWKPSEGVSPFLKIRFLLMGPLIGAFILADMVKNDGRCSKLIAKQQKKIVIHGAVSGIRSNIQKLVILDY